MDDLEKIYLYALRNFVKVTKKESRRVKTFWEKSILAVVFLIFIIVMNIKTSIAHIKRSLPDVFAWYETIQPPTPSILATSRDITDVCIASQNPGLHGLLSSLGIYSTCSREAASFVLMTVKYFGDKLTKKHWTGTAGGGIALANYLPDMDYKTGEDTQWSAWLRSRSATSITVKGVNVTIPPNPWIDMFPSSQQSFFMVPVVHEYAHSSNKLDIMSTRLAILYEHGLSGICDISINSQSSSEMFHDFWLSDIPPSPPSCGGALGNAIIAGGTLGTSGMYTSMMISEQPEIAAGAAVAGAVAGFATSMLAHNQVCNAERTYQQRTL